MKGYLLDENLPARLRFSPSLPVQAGAELGPSASDSALWEFARQRELVIVTKDADFSARIILSSPPPWVVHLRFGNRRRDEFHALLARKNQGHISTIDNLGCNLLHHAPQFRIFHQPLAKLADFLP